jgi:hypothetical protein
VAYTRTRDWATADYYAVLGVEPSATDEEIARAFRFLAKQLHPDAGVPAEVAERFKQVSVAYDVLGNERTRRDYDAVRVGVLPRPRVSTAGPHPASEAPRFRTAPPRPVGWTRRRAWLALVGGLVVMVLGIGASLFVIGLQHADSARRAGRIAVTATRVNDAGRAGIEFTTRAGRLVTTREPRQHNPGLRGTTVHVLYDPARPTDVIVDESYLGRNITLWIVAVKLLFGGPIFAILGWRALQRQRRSSATPM